MFEYDRYNYEEYLTQLADDLSPQLSGDLDGQSLYDLVNMVEGTFSGTLTAEQITSTDDIDATGTMTANKGRFDQGLWCDGVLGSTPTSGAGTRLMWIPAKHAFRAGAVGGAIGEAYWDAAYIGDYSVAFGYNSKATQNMSSCFGQEGIASGVGATHFGAEGIASAVNSAHFGLANLADCYAVMTLGQFSAATGGNTGSWVATDPILVIGNGITVGSRSTALTILKNGKVGIGTTPQAALHIATNVGSGIKLERGTLDARWWGASGGPAYFGTISNDALNIQTNNNTRMTIAAGGAGGAVDVVGNLTVGGTLGAGAITGTSFIVGGNTLDTNEWAVLDGIGANQVIDWTSASANFSTSGTLASGVQTITGSASTALSINQGADSKGLQINGFDDQSGEYFQAFVASTGTVYLKASLRWLLQAGGTSIAIVNDTASEGFAIYRGQCLSFGTWDERYYFIKPIGNEVLQLWNSTDTDTQLTEMDASGNEWHLGKLRVGDTTAPTLPLEVKADSIRIVDTQTPASDGTGTQGEIAWDADFVYICTATNTWKRAALTGSY